MKVFSIWDVTAQSGPDGDAGLQYLGYTDDVSLNVNAAGVVTGTVREELTLWESRSDPGKCFAGPQGMFIDCWQIYSIVQPTATLQVTGTRSTNAQGQPVLTINSMTPIQKWTTHWRQSATDAFTGRVYAYEGNTSWSAGDELPGQWNITLGQNGSAPIARHAPRSRYLPGRSEYHEDGFLVNIGDAPSVKLDTEMLERSVFFDQVPVNDRFSANMDWNAVGGGSVTWRLGQQAPDQSPTTAATVVPKDVDVGSQGIGRQPLQVQALNTLGRQSLPQTTMVTTVSPPADAGSPKNVKATKVGQSVAYSWSFAFPVPAFKAMTPALPASIPYVGGKQFGIVETQASGQAQVKSTGEGSVEASGQTGFKWGDEVLIGKVSDKGTVNLTPAGAISESAWQFKVTGQLSGEEPLLDLIPSLGPAVLAINKVCTTCAYYLIDRAKVAGEVSPNVAVAFVVRDQGQGQRFDSGQGALGTGIKGSLVVELIKDVLSVSGSLGGDGSVTFQVPAPYFKQADLTGAVSGQIVVYHWGWTGERSWTWTYPGQALLPSLASGMGAPGWQLLDRSYLTAPDYAHWTAPASVAAIAGQPVDVQLVQNVYPQAHPTLAVGPSRRLLVWAHDKPGSPALSGQEIMYTWAKGDSPACPGCSPSWQGARPVTNDVVADLNPQAAMIGDNAGVAVWQRFDTSNPPDFNTDPTGYVSHLGIGAAAWDANADHWSAPVQLTANAPLRGTANTRPQVAPLSNGALAVWVNNPADYLMGNPAHPDSIQYARYSLTTKTWSAPAPVASNLGGLLSMSLAANGNQAALVYALDADGVLTTTTDIDLYYTRWATDHWTAPTRLTDNAMPDDEPQLVLDGSGNPQLVWRQNGALVFLDGAWGGAPSHVVMDGTDALTDGRGLSLSRAADGNLLLSWLEGGNGAGLGYVIFDAASGKWGTARTAAAPPDPAAAPGAIQMMTYPSPALIQASAADSTVRDHLVLGYEVATAIPVTKTIQGVTVAMPTAGPFNLRAADVPLGVNLSITPAGLAAAPADAQPGDPITVTARVSNTGALAAGGVPVLLRAWQLTNPYDAGVVLGTQTLPTVAAGDAVTVTFAITRPLTGERALTVCIDGAPAQPGCVANHTLHETDETDNLARFLPMVTIESLPTDYTLNGVVTGARASQEGPLYVGAHFTATQHLDAIDGPVIGTVDLAFPKSPVPFITATSTISPGLLGSGTHLLYWDLDPSVAGQLGAVTPTHVSVLPDLTTSPYLIGYGKSPGSTAPFNAIVQNTGLTQSHGGQLAVYDGPPGQADTHSLLSLPLPDIPAGAAAPLQGTLNLTGSPAATTGLTGIYVEIDPDGAVADLNENNNLAIVGQPLGGGSTHTLSYLPLIRR